MVLETALPPARIVTSVTLENYCVVGIKLQTNLGQEKVFHTSYLRLFLIYKAQRILRT